MHRVVHQRGHHGAVGGDGLEHIDTGIIELGRVVIVGDARRRLTGRGFQPRRLEPGRRLPDRRGSFRHHVVQEFQIPAGSALAVRKAIRIRGAVGVGGANEDVVGRNSGNTLTNPVAEHSGKSEEVGADKHDAGGVLLQHQGPHRDLALLLANRIRRPDTAADRQQRIRRDHTNGNAGLERGLGVEAGRRQHHQEQDSEFHESSLHSPRLPRSAAEFSSTRCPAARRWARRDSRRCASPVRSARTGSPTPRRI